MTKVRSEHKWRTFIGRNSRQVQRSQRTVDESRQFRPLVVAMAKPLQVYENCVKETATNCIIYISVVPK